MAVEEKEIDDKESQENPEIELSRNDLGLDDPSPRCVLEIPVLGSDSDNSSNCSSCSPDKSSSSSSSSTPRGVSATHHHGLQWNKMIDNIKKKSMRRFSVIPLIASYELSRKNLRKKLPKIPPSEYDVGCEHFLFAKPSWRNFTYDELAAATDDFNPGNDKYSSRV